MSKKFLFDLGIVLEQPVQSFGMKTNHHKVILRVTSNELDIQFIQVNVIEKEGTWTVFEVRILSFR